MQQFFKIDVIFFFKSMCVCAIFLLFGYFLFLSSYFIFRSKITKKRVIFRFLSIYLKIIIIIIRECNLGRVLQFLLVLLDHVLVQVHFGRFQRWHFNEFEVGVSADFSSQP